MGDYQEAMSKVVQSQMKIIGKEKALKYASTVKGLTVAPDGSVVSFAGNDKDVLNELIQAYIKISPIAKMLIAKELKPYFDSNQSLEKPDILR